MAADSPVSKLLARARAAQAEYELFDQAQVDPYVFDPEGAEFNALPPQDLMPFNYLVNGCYADNSPIEYALYNCVLKAVAVAVLGAVNLIKLSLTLYSVSGSDTIC